MDYNVIWYVLLGVLLIGYAILDGFDLGVGSLHLLTKGDHNRRIVMNSIGPVWDGNEVWLITAGGAVFAAFPHVYATAFSGFYIPFMLLLAMLIFRAVSMEFRSKEPHPRWRQFWDSAFSISSAIAAILFGVTIGNAVTGINIGADKEYQGTLAELLNPYALMVGIFVLIVFALHGALYLIIKTEGDLQKRIKELAMKIYYIFIPFYLIVTAFTIYLHPQMISNFSFGAVDYIGPRHALIENHHTLISVLAWIIVCLNVLAVLNIHRCLVREKEHQGFISSALSIGAMIGLFALGVFPNMIVSTADPSFSLNIYNASSSQKTLETMFIMAVVGIPFVLSYTIAIYWVFRGKTQLDENSY